MREITLGGQRVALYALDTVVVGSGCAGFNAADTLFDLGRRDIALLTEGVNMGTSRNTGSDKQTYYKLSLCADAQDSVYQLAENLFAGGSVNGDTALAGKWSMDLYFESAGMILTLITLGKYLETRSRLLWYHTAKGEFSVRASLASAEKQLAQYHFSRCNQCYLVNLQYVKAVENDFVHVNTDRLEISRRQRAAFLTAVASYIGGVL